jgi:hypothetical protein
MSHERFVADKQLSETERHKNFGKFMGPSGRSGKRSDACNRKFRRDNVRAKKRERSSQDGDSDVGNDECEVPYKVTDLVVGHSSQVMV